MFLPAWKLFGFPLHAHLTWLICMHAHTPITPSSPCLHTPLDLLITHFCGLDRTSLDSAIYINSPFVNCNPFSWTCKWSNRSATRMVLSWHISLCPLQLELIALPSPNNITTAASLIIESDGYLSSIAVTCHFERLLKVMCVSLLQTTNKLTVQYSSPEGWRSRWI